MSEPQTETAPRRWLGFRLRRPRLFAGAAAGVAVYLILLLASSVTARLRFILAWDIGVIVALSAMFLGLRRASPERMRAIAARQITGQWTVLILTIVAASASLIAITAEVPLIKTASDTEQIARMALVAVTTVLSWALINTMFALHYAHDYYLRDGGIVFAGNKPPAYGDFIYFSFTIGMTFQVSDVQITELPVRQLAIAHGIIMFFYATVILAMTVNLVAGLL
jgi:uncharacterized membrane protein